MKPIRISIRNQFFLFILISILTISILVFQIIGTFARASLRNMMDNYVKQNQENIESHLNFLFERINIQAVQLLQEQALYDILNDKTLTHNETEVRLRQAIAGIHMNDKLISDIGIITQDQESYHYALEKLSDPDPLLLQHMHDKANIPIMAGIVMDGEGNASIMLIRKMINFYTGQNSGFMTLYIREANLRTILNNMMDWGFSFIVNDHSYVISHPLTEWIGSRLYQADYLSVPNANVYRYALSGENKMAGANWTIITVVSNTRMYQSIIRMNKVLTVVQCTAAMMEIIFAWYVSRTITSPVKRLVTQINKLGKHGMHWFEKRTKQNELWVLESSFNQMVARINDLLKKINEDKDKQRELELIALQAQINPHFLYNTLDSINWIAQMNRQEEIEHLVSALAKFFRLSLHKGDKFIRVSDEIGIVKCYVDIEAFRFPNQFTVEYDVDPGILDCRILKIILQPIVENAIKHGIGEKRGPGHIWIKGWKQDQVLLFQVRDDGIGFQVQPFPGPETQLGSTSYKGGGYGLRNVHERIILEYEPGSGVFIQSEPGSGTVVTIKLKSRM